MNSLPNSNQSPEIQKLFDLMCKDRPTRIKIVTQSHYWFFHFYFAHYVKYETAPFQQEIFALSENDTIPLITITAFRGSAKSTIMNLSYPLWSILGRPQRKFVLVVGQTERQARQHLQNIKREAESNPPLKNDLGPLQNAEGDGPWNANALLFTKYDAKIMAVSVDQAVRGLRHGPNRPDLIICDDIEDVQSTLTREARNKTYQWVTGELIPAGDTHTRYVFIGNLLHEDALLSRLRWDIDEQKLAGVHREYPLLDKEGKCLWPKKFRTPEDIDRLKLQVPNAVAFQREYLLRIVADAGQIIPPEWIQYYDNMPPLHSSTYCMSGVGVDLAISKNDSADYTAMVAAAMFRSNGQEAVYVFPHPVNAHLSFAETLERGKQLYDASGSTTFFVEGVGYQRAAVEQLNAQGIYAKAMPASGDKHARLAIAAQWIQQGKILFPRVGAEELILQLTGFGKERHDDLADAFAYLVLGFMQNPPIGDIYWVDMGQSYRPRLGDSWGSSLIL